MASTAANGNLKAEDIDYRIWIGTIATVVPATVAVILRFISRGISRAGLWWDDWIVVASLVVNWTMAITRWVQVLKYNFGMHGKDIPVHDIVGYQKSFMAIQLLYFANATLTKSSLLLFYRRIFGIVQGFRWALLVSWLLITGYFVACVIASIFGCLPVSYLWTRFGDPSAEGKCFNEIAFFRWNGIANMLLDVLMLSLPLPMVWGMRMGVRQKVLLTGVFGVGGFVCVVSLLRILSFNAADRGDPTYTQIPSSAWSSVEQGIGIVCACLPTLRPLQRLFCGCGRRESYDFMRAGASRRFGSITASASNQSQKRWSGHGQSQSSTDTEMGEGSTMRRWADDGRLNRVCAFEPTSRLDVEVIEFERDKS